MQCCNFNYCAHSHTTKEFRIHKRTKTRKNERAKPAKQVKNSVFCAKKVDYISV